MMDEGVYASFIRRQNKIHARIEEAREKIEFHSVKDLERFAHQHSDIAEDLSVALERSVTNMKKVQSRAKPSQAISKSLSVLMDIDTDVIDLLSDSERTKLSMQLSKLNQTVEELNSVCSEETEETKTTASNPSTNVVQNRTIEIGITNRNQPLVYCIDQEKPITNLMFTLHFSAYRYLDTQADQTEIVLYFVGDHNSVISDEVVLTVRTGEVANVHFTLYETASSMKECRLVIRGSDQKNHEALFIIPFLIKMAFSVDFGF